MAWCFPLSALGRANGLSDQFSNKTNGYDNTPRGRTSGRTLLLIQKSSARPRTGSEGQMKAPSRDWASETPRSLRRPPSTFPLHCTHPSSSTDSTCLRPRYAMGYLRLVGIAVRQRTPRPAGGTVVGTAGVAEIEVKQIPTLSDRSW